MPLPTNRRIHLLEKVSEARSEGRCAVCGLWRYSMEKSANSIETPSVTTPKINTPSTQNAPKAPKIQKLDQKLSLIKKQDNASRVGSHRTPSHQVPQQRYQIPQQIPQVADPCAGGRCHGSPKPQVNTTQHGGFESPIALSQQAGFDPRFANMVDQSMLGVGGQKPLSQSDMDTIAMWINPENPPKLTAQGGEVNMMDPTGAPVRQERPANMPPSFKRELPAQNAKKPEGWSEQNHQYHNFSVALMHGRSNDFDENAHVKHFREVMGVQGDGLQGMVDWYKDKTPEQRNQIFDAFPHLAHNLNAHAFPYQNRSKGTVPTDTREARFDGGKAGPRSTLDAKGNVHNLQGGGFSGGGKMRRYGSTFKNDGTLDWKAIGDGWRNKQKPPTGVAPANAAPPTEAEQHLTSTANTGVGQGPGSQSIKTEGNNTVGNMYAGDGPDTGAREFGGHSPNQMEAGVQRTSLDSPGLVKRQTHGAPMPTEADLDREQITGGPIQYRAKLMKATEKHPAIKIKNLTFEDDKATDKNNALAYNHLADKIEKTMRDRYGVTSYQLPPELLKRYMGNEALTSGKNFSFSPIDLYNAFARHHDAAGGYEGMPVNPQGGTQTRSFPNETSLDEYNRMYDGKIRGRYYPG
jgi:hypothetical protein